MPALPAHAPESRLLARAGPFALSEVLCRAGPRDAPFPELHARPCIALVCAGAFTYRGSAGRRDLSPGWLLLGRTGAGYECSHELSEHGDRCLSLELSDEALDEVGAGKGFAAPALPPSPRAATLLRLAARAAELPAGALALEQVGFSLDALVQRELGLIAGKRGPNEAPVGGAALRRVRAAAELLSLRSHEPLGLQDLATHAGLSPYHFLRAFRGVMGVTPHQLLMRIRLQRAVALLYETQLPVTEIAYEVGFGDLSNFVRTFHREVGCPPSALRRGRVVVEETLLKVEKAGRGTGCSRRADPSRQACSAR